MGIYIDGIEMPKKGNPITVLIYPDGMAEWAAQSKTGRAIPVPDRGRLISAKLLKADFTGNFRDEYPTALIHAMIDDAPTIIPADKEG